MIEKAFDVWKSILMYLVAFIVWCIYKDRWGGKSWAKRFEVGAPKVEKRRAARISGSRNPGA